MQTTLPVSVRQQLPLLPVLRPATLQRAVPCGRLRGPLHPDVAHRYGRFCNFSLSHELVVDCRQYYQHHGELGGPCNWRCLKLSGMLMQCRDQS